jgi:trehalose 6-phosphate phosphatase
LTGETAQKLSEFFCAFRGAPRPLLLTDYDGTLAAFRVNRFKARPWAGVQRLLSRIRSESHTRIAVITGRPAAEIPRMLTLDLAPEVWGLHGAERLYPDGHGELETVGPATHAKLNELRAQLREDSLGGLFEDKANAVVIHWRGHPPEEAHAIEARTRALFEPLAQLDSLALLKFEAGLELRAGRDKGGAVRAILREEDPRSPVTFLGDDRTDEAAFEAVNQAPGPHLSVLVRNAKRKTVADLWLKPPQQLRDFLERWLEASRQ